MWERNTYRGLVGKQKGSDYVKKLSLVGTERINLVVRGMNYSTSGYV